MVRFQWQYAMFTIILLINATVLYKRKACIIRSYTILCNYISIYIPTYFSMHTTLQCGCIRLA